MKIFSKIKSNRCQKCKQLRGNRFCLRIGKDICWKCCNEMRVDQKCPEACKYALHKVSELQFKTNTDSQYEYDDLLKKEIDHWIRNPQKVFEGKIPLKMSEKEKGRKQLEDFFAKYSALKYIPVNYLFKRLNLYNVKPESKEIYPELVAFEFMDKIVEQDWEATIDFLYNKKQYKNQELKNNYIKRNEKNKFLRKIDYYELISAAYSKDRKQALVHLEGAGKYDITIVMKRIKNEWLVGSKIFGKPEIYNSESEALQQIAILLSKNQTGNAYELLKKYSSIYIDSADLQYYWGLYYTFERRNKQALEHFFNAIEIDPEFIEAKYNYAYMLQTEKKFEKAKKIYKEIIKKNPKEKKSLNNLAWLYIEEGRKDDAKNLLERCLKIDPEFELAKKNLERLTE
ncbi:MAG: tetratricopeptide repeat protein [Candidatus Cloacimonadota bacterium]|nr:tetratricopeptide repeat protein [Candidatus Cloacimonadota bacterium]